MIRRTLIAVAGWLALAGASRAALVLHLPCNDTAASTVVDALVGTDAALQGGDNCDVKTMAGPGGSITLGLNLNGSDDYIDWTSSSISFANNSTWSASFWFKADGTSATVTLIGSADANAQSIRRVNNTTLRYADTAPTNYDFTVPAMGTTWHHCLVTCTASRGVRFFLDGTESSTTITTVAVSTFPPKYFGRRATAFWDGGVAQIKLFNTDESANVASLYAEGVSSGVGGAAAYLRQLGQRTAPRRWPLVNDPDWNSCYAIAFE